MGVGLFTANNVWMMHMYGSRYSSCIFLGFSTFGNRTNRQKTPIIFYFKETYFMYMYRVTPLLYRAALT